MVAGLAEGSKASAFARAAQPMIMMLGEWEGLADWGSFVVVLGEHLGDCSFELRGPREGRYLSRLLRAFEAFEL